MHPLLFNETTWEKTGQVGFIIFKAQNRPGPLKSDKKGCWVKIFKTKCRVVLYIGLSGFLFLVVVSVNSVSKSLTKFFV